ncbi:hypothetical protein JCM3766R1_000532 [Sporobolomyces carnicolor]
MPSYIALAATALASVHERILPIPLLVLGGAVPQLLPFVQHVLLRPFTLAATVIKHLGLLVQIAFLLQGILFEALGDGLNSLAASRTTPSSLSSPMQLVQARERLSELTNTVFPTSLASFYGTHFDPMAPSTDPSDPIQLSQRDVDEWHADGNKLQGDIVAGIKDSVDLWIEILDNPREEYLHAAKAELDRIQAGRATKYLYHDQREVVGDELSEKIAAADNEFRAEEQARLDGQFKIFLDRMGMDEAARNTLDNPSDPKDSGSQTFRQLLRASWEDMYGQGGVLGTVENEMSRLFGGQGADGGVNLGMGAPLEPGEDVEAKLSSPGYVPRRIPLMTIHLLRDQLDRAIKLKGAVEPVGLAKYLEPEDETDAQILPKVSRKVSDDYLGFLQRAVKIDVRAREIVLAILSGGGTPAAATSPTRSATSFASPSILLSSATSSTNRGLPSFGAFVKKLDWTLTRSSERFLRAHEFAHTAFGEDRGWIAVRRAEMEVERLETFAEVETTTSARKMSNEL